MTDEEIMAEAIREAKKGFPLAFPNPLVGCVVVRNGKIIARGHHAFFGGPHAEVNAAKKCSYNLRNASVYVTMEPCSSRAKKTPPCTDLLLSLRPEKVIIGDLDPNPIHNGRGVEILRKSGIKVKIGVLKKECQNLNPAFYKNMKEKLPYIILKMAQSINGKIADNRGNSKWISSEKSREYSHKFLRAACGCIISGVETIIKDDPELTVRNVKIQSQPAVCVIDPNLRTPISARIFKAKRTVYLISLYNAKNKNYPENVSVIRMSKKEDGFQIIDILKTLYEKGIRSVLVEGGGKTHGQFIRSGLFDKIFVFISPMIIGQENAISSVSWTDRFSPKKGLGIAVKPEDIKSLGPDLLLIYGKK